MLPLEARSSHLLAAGTSKRISARATFAGPGNPFIESNYLEHDVEGWMFRRFTSSSWDTM